jgi:hypothetical protein
MRRPALNPSTMARAGARGLVAAMAMTGVRTVTGNIGLLHKSPPEAIVERRAPERIRRLPPDRRAAITEFAHWSYGALGGAAYALLPQRVKADLRTGPAYGLALWLLYEAALAPVLDLQHTEQRGLRTRVMLALDHVMYGVVLAGWLAPEPAVTAHGRHEPGIER